MIIKNNHQKLGQELELFTTLEEAPGMPFFLPNGMIIRNELEAYWKQIHQASGYEEIKTPIMMKQHMWEQSGHWDHYQENMFFSSVEDQSYALKPMSCPGAVLLYNRKRRSYRELPIRYAELGLVHRYEQSGSLNGLLRVRSFTQDDAHLFVRGDQIEIELERVLDLVDHVYSIFGFNYHVELSTRPDDSMGSQESWDHAESALEFVLKKKGVQYKLNPGDGAFYGPKIDFHIQDSKGRSWQCGTIQLDFQMPEKFDCSYVDEKNENQTPILIHRAIYGAIERFMAILIEHYEGAFPFWLAPVQAVILPIHSSHGTFSTSVLRTLEIAGIRIKLDDRNEKFGLRIRAAQKQKIPYMLVIGDKEVNNNLISVRDRDGEQKDMTVEEFIQFAKN
ncbi:threonine--tRNA ligase [Shouchella patagoniensis]|uniref:threonine--tRNA ligase n=1 Tax=Shouchella patagoniensis TaxID=228576 RepID=UPI000994D668|nr:threonine--tRNA ligase [Shouchella patagoniensis]